MNDCNDSNDIDYHELVQESLQSVIRSMPSHHLEDLSWTIGMYSRKFESIFR